jgi:ABC-2 type transport system permease protein
MEDRRGPAWPLKLFRLWRLFAFMDFTWMTRDFGYFFSCLISEIVIGAAGVTAVFLLAERFSGIGVWSKMQVLFMLGYATTVNGILDMFFAFNVGHISRRIGRGQLDHTLIQPQPIWLTLLTEGFMPFSGSGVLICGVGLMCWATSRLGGHLTPGWIGLLVIDLIASSAIALALSYIWGSLAFWEPRAAEEISTPVVDIVRTLNPFPLDGLGPVASIGLMTVLPVGFVAWYPCRQLLGIGHTALGGVMTIIVAVIAVTLAALAFRKGMRHYAETGSQRYHGRGHRN